MIRHHHGYHGILIRFIFLAKKIPLEHLIAANRTEGRGLRGAGNVDLMQPATEPQGAGRCAC